jgi:hypothetical protein
LLFCFRVKKKGAYRRHGRPNGSSKSSLSARKVAEPGKKERKKERTGNAFDLGGVWCSVSCEP